MDKKIKQLEDISSILVSFLPELFGKILRKKPGTEKTKLAGITYHVLGMLSHRGDLSPSQIGVGLQVSRPNMTKLIDKLEEEGFVKRYQSKDDRRKILVCITPLGITALEDGRTVLKRKISHYLNGYKCHEINDIYEAVLTISNTIKKHSNNERHS